MLSQRGLKSATSQDIPWRFAPGGNNRYDSVTNPSGVISFATAENVSIPREAFLYRFSTMGGPRFPIAMARHLNEYFHPFNPIKPEQIITASGLTAIHELVACSIGNPGDGILVSRPVYGRFELDFGNTADLNIVYADMDGVDPFGTDAVPKYQIALENALKDKGIKVKALLIVNPHNPLGRCFPPSSLRELMGFCQRNSIHMISDEVYGLSVYGETNSNDERSIGFSSVLSIDSTGLIDPDRLHVFYGMSKDFGAAGLRLGCLITQSTLLRKAVSCNMRFHNPSGMSIAIATAILEDREFVKSFINISRQLLNEARQCTSQILDRAGIKYHSGSNAGFFLYIDLSPWLVDTSGDSQDENDAEYALAQKMLDAGVGIHPCEEHGESKGHFRLVFSQQRDILEEGLSR
ncbi:pyridoxal phosphate-dependent transferase [Talaromyces proteolyticus]|uniref:Pyridoxal phosphate-dependent transferase n=1 Tax=Talaromyces proteolyticus TaxID=1131652 RepID=A0AAD4L464_9EURO|nr:pyridoxal phosphate-dependent transferase [Talaromyces proteolyticus]KAH8705578.1 pyridoxal phosphate-dependent transferase [Talaromyces proteolyticus]